ncbi:MAG: T9SS type B sorting domain-containing protein [Flavobacteriaceae bacterium]|nr:T9SS type B sorting domain-containing protein [Flavobacteriaceae bacterium]
MRQFIFILFLTFNVYFSVAQGEANVWYFGNNAGLDFNTSPPTPLLDGQINTPEGCSTISDANGNLLLYTDGRTVWDREHNIMPNGDYFGGTGLLGDPSSTQSGLIVPHPLLDDLFYVFTVDEPHHENAFAYPNQGPALPDGTPVDNYQDVPSHTVPQDDDGFNNGLNYSVVDMNLRNGLGDIVEEERNIHLVTYDENDPEEIKYQCSEKITAVAGADCESIWVITHFIDKFYAFKIDEDGIQEEPVVSTVSPAITIDNYRRASIGYLKASPDGAKLASATITSNYNQQGTNDAGNGHVYLYDFDNETGQVSNSIPLITNVRAYGVEFSENSKRVYATVDQPSGTSILQWNLEAQSIPQSQHSFSGVNLNVAAALQLAPDGKIYVSALGLSRLNVINQPNELGANANYTENVNQGAVNLNGRSATFGLPPFIQSFFTSTVEIVPDDANLSAASGNNYFLCFDETVSFGFESPDEATYVWYENDEILEDETGPFLNVNYNDEDLIGQTNSYRLEIFPTSEECKINGLTNVTFSPLPLVQEIDLLSCLNSESGISVGSFNLTNATSSLLVNEEDSIEDFEFSFFEDEELTQEIEEVTNFETSLQELQIYALVENATTRCQSTVTINLFTDFASVATTEISACDEFQNNLGTFNLPSLQNQFESISENFYLTEQDALSETNPIGQPESFVSEGQTVYSRVVNDDLCDELLIIELRVDALPEFRENEVVFYCEEDFPNTITLNSGLTSNFSDYDFFWMPNGETTESIEINEIGEYEVFILDLNTGCENSRVIEVKSSSLTNFDLITTDASSNNSIEVVIPSDAPGDYEYALNNPEGPYQDSPVFNGLEPDDYRVYVRDKNGCGISSKSTTIIGIMKFFTPNADGVNDFWGLRGNRPGIQDQAQISVFDRYGKLLYQFTGAERGWDGNYNGKPMPSNDYWYYVELEDGRIVKGNFTLKR